MKTLSRFELTGEVTEEPTPMVKIDGSYGHYAVRLLVNNPKSSPSIFNVCFFDKAVFHAIESLKKGDRIYCYGRMTCKCYKGFFNINLYGDGIFHALEEEREESNAPKQENELSEDDIPF